MKYLQASSRSRAFPVLVLAALGIATACSDQQATASLKFTDVTATDPFCRHIHYLWAKQVAEGCSATTFCPSAEASRAAAAMLLARGNGFSLPGL